MKTFRFIFLSIVTITLIVFLNEDSKNLPPLGKLLSPHHGFWQNAESKPINLPQSMDFKGITEKVEVKYDKQLVPHIFAANELDMYFVQGYTTAHHRLWQMDFFSRVVFGRLSEVLGERVLDYDRLNRRVGLKNITENVYQLLQLDPEMLARFKAYTDGVNAYIDELDYKDYPIEFKLLNYSPERWSVLKSCIGYAQFSNTLSRFDEDLENTNALNVFGRNIFDILYPEQKGNLDPVIPKNTSWNIDPIQVQEPAQKFVDNKQFDVIPKPHPLNGSNSFAVDGSKTASGNAILANEMDLNLTLPSIWYVVHLSSPGINVMGVSLPGSPAVIVGFNDSIAWSSTNSPRDQVDWYKINFKDEKRNEYRYNNEWFKTSRELEKYEIKNQSTFYDTIVYTHHGPVVYDQNYYGDSSKLGLSMKWVANRFYKSIYTVFDLNKARNHDEFVAAMKNFQGPPQNFIMSSYENDIAVMLPGKFPVKWNEQGKFLLDGANIDHEWQEYIPFEHNISIKNPDQGYLASANQHQVDSLYPYYVYDGNYEVFRNRRLNDRLKVMNNIRPEDMMKLQHDNFNYIASESLPMMLDSLDTSSFDENHWKYYTELKQWDYFNDPENAAASVYELWWDILYLSLWDEFSEPEVKLKTPDYFVTIDVLANYPELELIDNLSTPEVESTKNLIQNTFRQALDSIDQWKKINGEDLSWFLFKNSNIRHLLRLEPFSYENIRIGGNHNIVNAANNSHGPSWRMVVQLSKNGPDAWGVYPGSQTGNPGNPLYAHMIENWAHGDYYQLIINRNDLVDDLLSHTLIINPD